MKKTKEIWSKKLVFVLCLIMVAAFTAGCADEYYYQMHESEYATGDDSDSSDENASGLVDYEEEDDYSKGNSGNNTADIDYTFRNDNLLDSHYEKHGEEMGFDSPEDYEDAANKVIDDEDVLHKIEEEDGDDVYYLEETNEFVVVSKDGYIRTYFYPNDGIDYFNRQ